MVFEEDGNIFIGRTHLFCVVDTFVFILDKYEDKNFTIINTENGHAARICPVGQGPGEIINPSWYVNVLKDKENELLLYVFDIAYSKWFIYNLDSALIDNQTAAFNTVSATAGSFEEGGISTHIEILNDSTWIGSGIYIDGVFSFFNNGIRGKEMVELAVSEPRVSKFYQSLADASDFDLSSDKQHLVRSRNGLIELYTIDGDTLINNFSHEYFKYDYSIVDGQIYINEKTRYGYISACVSSNRVYGLYSGKLEIEPNSFQSQYIHVYDFKGNLLEIIDLDTPICAMDINSKGDIIYALSAVGERKLISFKTE
ncbi:hypothetical protein FACS18947_0580 [Bacteroidia bacterium]|nr:hypothetical protein FACS18947_0580 [Bacteroidia bacterium]